ncbi:MAG: DCC1-like thiol-disulfide oxidoreductase family protein [Pseudomonadota bacterium]
MNKSIFIFYDGECIFCDNYVKLLRLRQSFDNVELVDLRIDKDARDHYRSTGLDPDEGMIVKLNGTEYWGADAVEVLAVYSEYDGFLNSIQKFILSSKTASRLLYPLFRFVRNSTLKVRRVKPL